MFRRAICLLIVLGGVTTLFAQPSARQYYSEWKKHPAKPYYYRSYYYKKSASDREYSYHYGIYYPSRGKRVYMYNPHKKTYWGYWEGEKYSLLPAEKRKALIDDIAAEDFPPPGKAPKVPEAEDDVVMIPPPNDFPSPNDDKP